MVNVQKIILIFSMLYMRSNIDYEKSVLEVKFEEFKIDELQHVEESYIYVLEYGK